MIRVSCRTIQEKIINTNMFCWLKSWVLLQTFKLENIIRLRPTLWIWKGAFFSRGTIWISIASWQSSTPSSPAEKEVVNWRVQVFANSTVNLHFHRKKIGDLPVYSVQKFEKMVYRLWWIHSLLITMSVWLKSFKFFGKALLDIVLQFEACFRGRFLRIKEKLHPLNNRVSEKYIDAIWS